LIRAFLVYNTISDYKRYPILNVKKLLFPVRLDKTLSVFVTIISVSSLPAISGNGNPKAKKSILLKLSDCSKSEIFNPTCGPPIT